MSSGNPMACWRHGAGQVVAVLLTPAHLHLGHLAAPLELLLRSVGRLPRRLLPVGPRLLHGLARRLPLHHQARPPQQHGVLRVQAAGVELQVTAQRVLRRLLLRLHPALRGGG